MDSWLKTFSSKSSPETHVCEQEIKKLWESIEQSLEHSGYARANKEGIFKYELFPNRYTDYLDFEKKAEEAKKKYKHAQSREALIVDAGGSTLKKDPEYAWYKEYIFYPGTKRDARIQSTFAHMDHIFSMAKLRASFTEHLKSYIEVRYNFENTCSSVASMVNMLISTTTANPKSNKTRGQNC